MLRVLVEVFQSFPNAPDQKRGTISSIEPTLCTRLLNLEVGVL